MNATTTAPQPGQTVFATIDPRRAARPGIVQTVDLEAGFAVVDVETAKGATLTKRIRFDRIEVVDTATAEDIADAPEVDEPAGLFDAELVDEPTAQDNVDAAAERLRIAIEEDDHEDDIAGLRDELADARAEARREAIRSLPTHTRDECEDLDGCTAEHLAAEPVVDEPKVSRSAKPAKKAALPEGYVTPVGLAKAINTAGLYTGSREGGLSSQMLYSYLAKDDTYPGATVNGRANVVELQAGLDWWKARAERAGQRRSSSKVDRFVVAAELAQALDADDPIAAVRKLVEALGAE